MPSAGVTLTFDKINTYNHIGAQLLLGNRIPGTQARLDCVDYFISEFGKINSSFYHIIHNFTVHSTACQNVLFKLNTQKKNVVILGAHYDSRAKATKDIPANNQKPVPGANDGASGSAALIELARAFHAQKSSLDCQIWFLFFDAEDQGYDVAYGMEGWGWCEGSTQFVTAITSFYDSTTESFDCMVLLDMVGGTGLEFIKEGYSTATLLDELFTIGRGLGYGAAFPLFPTTQSVTDDHVAFKNHGIPSADLVINFWSNTNWPHHHLVTDDLTYISQESLDITGKTVEQFVYNNYHVIYTNRSNYPWGEGGFEIYFFIFLIGTIALVGISIISIRRVRKKSARKEQLKSSIKTNEKKEKEMQAKKVKGQDKASS